MISKKSYPVKNLLPYEFGITGHWHSAFDLNASRLKRLRKLTQQEESEEVLKVCQHYISHFIPTPVENEAKYWIISCFPSTDKSWVRVSIWFPEVFNISASRNYFGNDDRLQVMIFVHREFLDADLKEEMQRKIRGLRWVPYYRFQTGIDAQLGVFLPLSSYFDFVKDERIYESIRAHNYELSSKGKTPFKRGHSFEFVRYLFGDESYLEMD